MVGGAVTNNVALPAMLLTSSPRQQFHLFFSSHFLIYLSISHVSIHLNSLFFLCHFSSCYTLLHGNTSQQPVPSHSPLILRPPLTISSFRHSTFEMKIKRVSGSLSSLLLLELHKSGTPLHLRVQKQRKNSTFFLLRGKNGFQHHRGY